MSAVVCTLEPAGKLEGKWRIDAPTTEYVNCEEVELIGNWVRFRPAYGGPRKVLWGGSVRLTEEK